jgi:hypothetical protein
MGTHWEQQQKFKKISHHPSPHPPKMESNWVYWCTLQFLIVLSTIYIPNCVHHLFWPRLIEGHELWGTISKSCQLGVFARQGGGKMLNLPQKNECTQCKKYCCKFFPQSALCHTCFYIVIPNHGFGSMLWIFLTCYVPFGTFITCYVLFGYEHKTCPCFTQFVFKNINGTNGRLKEKIAVILLYQVHSISLADLTSSVCNPPNSRASRRRKWVA